MQGKQRGFKATFNRNQITTAAFSRQILTISKTQFEIIYRDSNEKLKEERIKDGVKMAIGEIIKDKSQKKNKERLINS